MSGDITFTPSPEVCIAAAKLSFRHQLSTRKFWIRLLLLVAVAMTVASMIVIVTDGNAAEAVTAAGLGALWGLAVLAIIIGGNYLLLPRRSRRLFSQDKSIGRPTRFTWNDEEAEWRSTAGSYRARWEDHHGWAKGADVLIFFANERLYRFVPTAALDESQRAELVARVEAAKTDA